jgi:hypothetical protein
MQTTFYRQHADHWRFDVHLTVLLAGEHRYIYTLLGAGILKRFLLMFLTFCDLRSLLLLPFPKSASHHT